jgi:hypothetical protein
VCVCVCVCVCVYTHTHTFMYLYTHTHTNIHTLQTPQILGQLPHDDVVFGVLNYGKSRRLEMTRDKEEKTADAKRCAYVCCAC